MGGLDPFGTSLFHECGIPLPGRLCWTLPVPRPVLMMCVCHGSKFQMQSHFVLASDLIPGNRSRIDPESMLGLWTKRGMRHAQEEAHGG